MIKAHQVTTRNAKAFTVVELVVVIAVIGILAALGIIGYGAWQKDIRENQVKSDLRMAATAMEDSLTFSDDYPPSLNGVFTASDGVTVTGGRTAQSAYCLRAVSSKVPSIIYSIGAKETEPTQGECQVPVTPSLDGSSIGYHFFMKTLFITIKQESSGPPALAYEVKFRDDRSAPLQVAQMPVQVDREVYSFPESHPLTQSYLNGSPVNGSLQIRAIGSRGPSIDEQVIIYGSIEEWD